MKNITCLFLGAGASYELGLPLVWELTGELKKWLTKEKLVQLNSNWKDQGGGYSEETIGIVIELLSINSMHYENLISALEVELNRERDNTRYQELHAIRSWLLEMIYWILLQRQVLNAKYISKILDDFSGIKKLAQQSEPLWVFSLNHDIILEIISAKYDIPIKSGFNEIIFLPARSKDEKIIGRIPFEYLSRKDIESNNYNFFWPGQYGINLIKMHGALDIFGKNDELNYIKLKPDSLECNSYISDLKRVNEELRFHPFIKCTNEIAYADEQGEVQFLRRSLLSGVHKFSGKMTQIAPPEFLKLFQSYLNYCDEFICIGYSFGDSHIDLVIRNWLSFSNERILKIINPGITAVPNSFGHLCRQISIVNQTCVEFFLSLDPNKSERGKRV